MPLQVELVSVESKVWSGEASMVVARTPNGDLGILPGHAPVLAVLSPSEITIKPADGSAAIIAHAEGGFLSVEHDRVTIVADRAGLGAPTA